MEEERRMLYVAMTRARQMLTISYVAGTKEEPDFSPGSLRWQINAGLFISDQSIHQTHNCPDIRRMHQQPFHTHRHPHETQFRFCIRIFFLFRITVEPNFSVFILTVFIQRKQYDIAFSLHQEL
ncbi:MAG: 3'-5' exonuclease [Eisenbergiella massiliensis]